VDESEEKPMHFGLFRFFSDIFGKVDAQSVLRTYVARSLQSTPLEYVNKKKLYIKNLYEILCYQYL